MIKTLATLGISIAITGCLVGDPADGSNDENIIGGVTDNGDPSVVLLFAHQPGQSVGSVCTGSVISSTAVLTAAHCVDPRVVGSGNVFEVFTGTVAGQTPPLAVASTAFDPAFDVNNVTAGHDIGIVKLAAPTALKPLPFNRGPLGAGPVRLVGYGLNTHVDIAGIPNGVGTKRTVTTTIASSTPTLVTIGSAGATTCHGDSGGPAFQVINGQEVIIGTTSFGPDLSAQVVCIGAGTDTRVDAFQAFIDAHK
jgi:secreted trypsin-like serine protease